MNTPGPWKMVAVDGKSAMRGYGENLIAETVSLCNAPLIAMAPDLRLFLDEVIKAHDEGPATFEDMYRIAINLKKKLMESEL